MFTEHAIFAIVFADTYARVQEKVGWDSGSYKLKDNVTGAITSEVLAAHPGGIPISCHEENILPPIGNSARPRYQ